MHPSPLTHLFGSLQCCIDPQNDGGISLSYIHLAGIILFLFNVALFYCCIFYLYRGMFGILKILFNLITILYPSC